MDALRIYLYSLNIDSDQWLMLLWASVLLPACLMVVVRLPGVRLFLSMAGFGAWLFLRLHWKFGSLHPFLPYDQLLDGICAGLCVAYAFLSVRKATGNIRLWMWIQGLVGLYSWVTVAMTMYRCKWHDPDPFWARVYYYAGWNSIWVLLLLLILMACWPRKKLQLPACESCGYCLRGLNQQADCPECGCKQKHSPMKG